MPPGSVFSLYWLFSSSSFGTESDGYPGETSPRFPKPSVRRLQWAVFHTSSGPGANVTHQFPSNPRGYFDAESTLTYRTNSLGFRGPETSLAKPEDKFRIIGLGDSFTFGTGVKVEDIFLPILQRRLNLTSDGREYETLNFGHMGYDIMQEVILLRHYVIDFEPDVVLIGYHLNDARPNLNFYVSVMSWGQGGIEWSRRLVLVEHLLWRFQRKARLSRLNQAYHDAYKEEAKGWILAREAIDQAIALSKRHSFDLALVIWPIFRDLSDDYPFKELHKKVAAFARERGIPAIDLLSEFDGYEGPELWVHPTNQHPNEIAHRIVGEAVYRFLRNEVLLDPFSVKEESMLEETLEAWRTNNRINLFLIDRISEAGMHSTLSKRGGRDVAEQFAHLHNNRVWQLQGRAKDLAKGVRATSG